MIFLASKRYGRWLYYPGDLQAETICKIAGKQTLSANDLQRLHNAGFDVKIQPEKHILESTLGGYNG